MEVLFVKVRRHEQDVFWQDGGPIQHIDVEVFFRQKHNPVSLAVLLLAEVDVSPQQAHVEQNQAGDTLELGGQTVAKGIMIRSVGPAAHDFPEEALDLLIEA